MGNIRPFQLPNDIDIMVKLIREGFQYPENPSWSVQTDENESMLDQIDGVKRFWPLVRILQLFIPILRDVIRGFIYEEDHQPVGLINFMRHRNAPEWLIANVTVLPAYRRRGVARKLVEAALEDLRARKAKTIYLEVIAANLPAYNLYKDLGFAPYASSSEYNLRPEQVVAVIDLPKGYHIQPIGRFEWRRQMDFAKRITPTKILDYEPIREDRFRPSISAYLLGPLFESIGGSRQDRFAIVTTDDEKTVAIGIYTYRTRAGGVNRASVELDPVHAQLAEFIGRHLISEIQMRAPGRRTEIQLNDWQPALGQTFEILGCVKRFTVHKMGLLFK